ncbi:MAG: DNA polymerase III subunit delta', partial [Oscillospiraceae bacterium]|nr:DNA polymerase III subunit delta' [Oscillospiraceae bacterium]
MKMYSKQTLTSPLRAMYKSGRFVHSYIITGAKGVGKKTAALYTAQALLCSDVKDGIPCGVCRECRRIEANTHPDCIRVEKSKRSYSVDDMRHIVTDAYTSP